MKQLARANRARLFTLMMIGGALMPAAAMAQAQPDAAGTAGTTASETDAGAVDNIVVTARFRNEKLQDTPLSVSALNSNIIQNSVLLDVQNIQKFLPNVQLARISFAGNALAASIRGVSFADLEKTFDPAIGISIDGVFLGTNTGANVDFFDLESVEVLRGPQGTLYGRNTIGGTISMRRTKPTGELGATLHGRYGSYGTYDLDAVVNLPKIGDVASIKLFGLLRKSDSFTRNRYTGEREKGRDFWNVGGSVLLDLGPDTTALLSVDYQKDRSAYPSTVNLTTASGLPFGAGGNICDFTQAIFAGIPPLQGLGCASEGYLKQAKENYTLANSTIPFQSFIDGINTSLEINAKLGGFKLTAITGYRDTTDSLLEENTGAPPIPVAPGVSLPLFVAARDQKYKQFSQEVRVSGNLTDRIDIVAGAYYLHTDYFIQPYPYNGSRAAQVYVLNGPAQSFTAGQKLDSFAVFAESIIKLGSNVRLTVGGRYTWETKDFNIDFTVPGAFSAAAKKTFSDPTGRVILDWKPNPDTMLYASWSRGFRSGGFNGRATSPTSIGPYNPERVDSFEGGVKSDLMGGKLRFNPTVFYVKYSNKQEDIIRAAGAGTETVVENAASARIWGIELEMQARPTPDLTLRASGGYLNAKYNSFLIPDLANPGQFLNVSGQRNFRRAPKYSFNAGVDYGMQISSADRVTFTLDYAYIDDLTASPLADTTGLRRDVIPAYGTLDASIALLHEGSTIKNLRVSAYARDMLNKGGRLANVLDAGLFYFGVVAPRQQFGIEATIKF
ncbi:TonB-dependent receptor [Novosphingobium sediminis]|uniref:TonB-dependent receptor n=1 Tax=Novosphingobium sediminis TaxID=707214 RepID=A0A512AMJ7_9SPHN|nr:TonB-dependent receptor [Novosphingobium sediminis]GEO00930.1 TonB-dependent receptor [Novosphingobium sediminis]